MIILGEGGDSEDPCKIDINQNNAVLVEILAKPRNLLERIYRRGGDGEVEPLMFGCFSSS